MTLTDGQTVLTADFGFAAPTASTGGTIGDLVWDDADGDGVLDAGEAGVAGVMVTLRADPGGDGVYDVIATQVTAADGSYSFANLPADRYRLVVSVPAGSLATTPTANSVNLGAGASVDTADFGLASQPPAPGTLGDRVWDDVDGDGMQDAGELGLANVTVTIRSDLDGDGVFETVIATVVTDATGNYSLSAAPGNYRVVVARGGRTLTTPISVPVTITPGSTVDTSDFGLTTGAALLGGISDRVWLDVDRDGVQDADEPGVNGATVTLRQDADGDGSFEVAVTSGVSSGDGNYGFANLAPGTYLIVVTPPDGLSVTVPSIEVQLVAGQMVADADIGLAAASALPYDLDLVKSLSGTAVEGTTATWEITVSNLSVTPTPAMLTVVDSLPAGLSFVSAAGTGWVCTAAGQDVTCTGGGPLDRGDRAQIQIVTTILATAGTELRNVAIVTATGPELSFANNTDDASRVGQPSSHHDDHDHHDHHHSRRAGHHRSPTAAADRVPNGTGRAPTFHRWQLGEPPPSSVPPGRGRHVGHGHRTPEVTVAEDEVVVLRIACHRFRGRAGDVDRAHAHGDVAVTRAHAGGCGAPQARRRGCVRGAPRHGRARDGVRPPHGRDCAHGRFPRRRRHR